MTNRQKTCLVAGLLLGPLVLFYSYALLSRIYRFVSAPTLARIVVAANAPCSSASRSPASDTVAWRIDRILGRIYRPLLFTVGVDEVLEDGEAAISFFPIAYDQFDGKCVESALPILDHFLREGFDINRVHPQRGFTVLHESIVLGDTDVVELLLARGASVTIRTKNQSNKTGGMNAKELAQYYLAKEPSDGRRQIATAIEKRYNQAL